MRHKSNRSRLNQKPDYARSMERNLVTSVLLYESIRTIKKRALVIRPIVDGLITTAKTKPAHIAIRAINRIVTDKNASRKLMEVLRPRYATRTGGYSVITAVGSRKGDGAAVVDFSLVDAVVATSAAAPEKKVKKTTKQPTQPKSPKKPTKSAKQSSESSVPSVPSVPSDSSPS